MKRRILGILSALAIAASLLVVSAASADSGRFTDDDGNTHEANIELIAIEGITLGCNADGTLYCPADRVTRGQMAAFIVRALGLVNTNTGNVFTDDDGSIFENDIEALQAAGVTLGCSATEYCPNDFVTRGQMAAFLSRAFHYSDRGTGNYFTDDNGSVFEEDIDKLRVAGITLGCNADGTRYCPNDFVRRDQMASFLARALSLDGVVTPPTDPTNPTTPTDPTTAPTQPTTTSTTVPDSGFTWRIETVSSSGSLGSDNDVAAVDGLAVISTRENGSNSAALVRCANAACSATLSIEVMDDGSLDGIDTALGIIDGTPVIASQELSDEDLRVVRCTDVACATWAAQTPVSTGNVGASSSLVIMDGKPVIGFYDQVGSLRVAACADASCTSATVTTIDGAVGTATNTAMAVVNGMPAIAYWDAARDDLEFARCTVADCTSFQHNVVDFVNDVGQGVDLAVIGGLPVMSYRDETNDTVKLARCTSYDCAAASIYTIDGTSDVGIFTAVAAGIDGYAWVAYYDRTNEALRFADCENATCSSVLLETVDEDDTADLGREVEMINLNGAPFIVYYDNTADDMKIASGS